jgi:uncharacterized protein
VSEFTPPWLLRNPHLMTLASAFWPRRFPAMGRVVAREFETEPETRLLAACHWQREPQRHPTLVLVHGLEGSIESNYMRGIAEEGLRAGFNALRVNQRNCGGTEGLTPTLYNSSLSDDYRAIISELIREDRLPEIFAVGYSMGGNLVLKMAGEMGTAAPPELRGIAGVCPAIDLAAGADALDEPQNRLYQWRFVRGLKKRVREKERLFPQRYKFGSMEEVRSVRQFDDAITAPHSGFRDAADYYAQASARQLLARIAVPTLLLAAQDDPVVPFASFRDPAIAQNPHITLLAPLHGGHCAFISTANGGPRFWAEAQIVEFCRAHSRLLAAAQEAPDPQPVSRAKG